MVWLRSPIILALISLGTLILISLPFARGSELRKNPWKGTGSLQGSAGFGVGDTDSSITILLA